MQFDDPWTRNRMKQTTAQPRDYSMQQPVLPNKGANYVGQSLNMPNNRQSTSLPTAPTTPRTQNASGAPIQQTQPLSNMATQTGRPQMANMNPISNAYPSATHVQPLTMNARGQMTPMQMPQVQTPQGSAQGQSVQSGMMPPNQAQQMQMQQMRTQNQPVNQAANVPVNLQKRSWLPSASNEMDQLQAISDQLSALRAMRNGAGQFQYNGQMTRRAPIYQGNWQ